MYIFKVAYTRGLVYNKPDCCYTLTGLGLICCTETEAGMVDKHKMDYINYTVFVVGKKVHNNDK